MSPREWEGFAKWLRQGAAVNERVVLSAKAAIELADLIDRYFGSQQSKAA